MSLTARSAKIAVLVAALTGLALLPACGRRGPLEPPPGTTGRAAPTAQDAQNNSTFAGSTNPRPIRQTETTGNTADADAPAAPLQPAEMVAGPNTVNPIVSTPSVTRSGGSQQRGPRRSPPPTSPFFLDPLL